MIGSRGTRALVLSNRKVRGRATCLLRFLCEYEVNRMGMIEIPVGSVVDQVVPLLSYRVEAEGSDNNDALSRRNRRLKLISKIAKEAFLVMTDGLVVLLGMAP